MKYQKCDACPHEDTHKCDTCGQEPESMELTYTFTLREGICNIDGLHNDLDRVVSDLGLEIVKSVLESPDEESEHDLRKELRKMSDNNCIMPEMPYCPACEYGHIVYKDEDYDGIEPPTECEWVCTLKKEADTDA